MKTRSYFIAFLTSVAALVFVTIPGCSNNSDFKDISVQDFGARVHENLPNLNSYETELEMSFNMEGVIDNQSLTTTMTITATRTTDQTAKKTGMDMSMKVKGTAGSDNIDQNERTSIYIIDGTSYVGKSNAEEKMYWSHETATSTMWEEQLQTEQLMKLLDNSKINSLQTETIQGVRCFLLELNPDLTSLWDTISSQIGESSSGTNNENMANFVKKATVKYWFTQDKLFFKKVYIHLDMEMDAEALEADSGSIHYTIEMNQFFNKHNQKLDIHLPPEATDS
jgi:hypothetical protein